MVKECFSFCSGSAELNAVIWKPEGDITAILQITHGMTEHIDRYQDFAEALVGNGILVAGFDLRGHGRNPGSRECASFGESGWEASLQDMYLFSLHLQQLFPGVPHYMLGFSLGSFLLREYLSIHPEGITGAVIAGSGQQPGWLLGIMMPIVKGQLKKCGWDGTTDLVKKLSFGVYNDKFKPNRTEADWLCSDNAQLDEYIADPLCRKTISAGLFYQLLSSMKRTCAVSSYDGWNKNLSVLLLSGDRDPVGDLGKGIAAVEKTMAKAGLTSVTCHSFPGARHDLFHEKDSGTADAVTGAILSWMEK